MRFLFISAMFFMLNLTTSFAAYTCTQPADADTLVKLINSGDFLKPKHIAQLKKLATDAGYNYQNNPLLKFHEKAEIYNNFAWREDMTDIAPTAYLIAQKYKFIVPATNVLDQEVLMQKLYTQLELLSRQSVSADIENRYPREILLDIWNHPDLRRITNQKEFCGDLPQAMELINSALAQDNTLGEKLWRISVNVRTVRSIESPFTMAENIIKNNAIKNKTEEFIRQINSNAPSLNDANSYADKAKEIIMTPFKPIAYFIYGIIYFTEEVF